MTIGKASYKMMPVIVEIDQSGKLEQLNTGTVVAYSNGKAEAVWIKAALRLRSSST